MAGLRRAQTTTGRVAVPPGYNTGIRTKRRLAGSSFGLRLASTPLLKQALDEAELVALRVGHHIVVGAPVELMLLQHRSAGRDQSPRHLLHARPPLLPRGG